MADDAGKNGSSKPFWSTLPGLLTGVAAILTAFAGLIATLHTSGLLDRSKEQTKSSSAEQAPPFTPPKPPSEMPGRSPAKSSGQPSKAAESSVSSPPIEPSPSKVVPLDFNDFRSFRTPFDECFAVQLSTNLYFRIKNPDFRCSGTIKTPEQIEGRFWGYTVVDGLLVDKPDIMGDKASEIRFIYLRPPRPNRHDDGLFGCMVREGPTIKCILWDNTGYTSYFIRSFLPAKLLTQTN